LLKNQTNKTYDADEPGVRIEEDSKQNMSSNTFAVRKERLEKGSIFHAISRTKIVQKVATALSKSSE